MDKTTKIIVTVIIIAISSAIGIQIFLRGFESWSLTGTWISENSSKFIFYSDGRVYYASSSKDIYPPLHGKYKIFDDKDSPLNQMWLIWDDADWWVCRYYFRDNGKTLYIGYVVKGVDFDVDEIEIFRKQ